MIIKKLHIVAAFRDLPIDIVFDKTRIWWILLCGLITFSCGPDKPSHQDRVAERKKTYLEDYRSPDFHWGFLQSDGRIAIQARFDEVRDFTNGLSAVNEGGLWGAIDTTGSYVIQTKYHGLWTPCDDLLRASNFAGRYGFLSTTGDTLISFQFRDARNFNDGIALVARDSLWGLIDRRGSYIIHPTYRKLEYFNTDLFISQTDKGWGIINSEGTIIISPEYSEIEPTENMDFIPVCLGEKCGYINIRNQHSLPFLYRSVEPFEDSRAIVSDKEGYYLIDTSGRRIGPKAYSYIQYLNSDRWAALQDGSFILLNEAGEAVNDQKYKAIYPFSYGLAAYQENRLWGYINRSGLSKIKAEFGLAWTFENGMARVAFQEGIGLIDTGGRVILAPYYPEIRNPSEGFIPFKRYRN